MLAVGLVLPVEFQHTAARRWLDRASICETRKRCFNTQPPEGGWADISAFFNQQNGFNTQPPEGGWVSNSANEISFCGFNTQPPEGGWVRTITPIFLLPLFQHTAARRRLVVAYTQTCRNMAFQHTAARRRLAATQSNHSKTE